MIDSAGENVPFLSVGQINEFRRKLIKQHTLRRIESHPFIRKVIETNSAPYTEKKLSYKANISNKLAERFYKKHGIEQLDEAFELANLPYGKGVMTTRYCILSELGLCNGTKGPGQVKYFLQDSNHKYPLHFNCNRCEMKIYFPE